MTLITWDSVNKESGVTLSNGNLSANINNINFTSKATEGKSEGRWYWEIEATHHATSIASFAIGLANKDAIGKSTTSSNARYYTSAGKKTPENINYGGSYKLVVIGVALDLDLGTLTFYKDGVSQGISHTNIKEMGEVFPAVTSTRDANYVLGYTANFGATPFKYDMPENYSPYDVKNAKWFFKSKILLLSNEKTYSLEADATYKGKELSSGIGVTLSNTNKTASITGLNYTVVGEKSVSSEKFYWEVKIDSGTYFAVGVTKDGVSYTSRQDNTGNSRVYYVTGSPYSSAIVIGDVISVLLDMEDGIIEFWKNGVSLGVAFTNLKTLVSVRPSAFRSSSTGSASFTFAFEDGDFLYKIPKGYKPYGQGKYKLNQIPSHSEQNLIKYGIDSPVQTDGVFTDKNYILQDTVSENTDGLWITRINRKPLSIKFN